MSFLNRAGQIIVEGAQIPYKCLKIQFRGAEFVQYYVLFSNEFKPHISKIVREEL